MKGNEKRTTFSEKYKYMCKIYHEKYDEEICRDYYEHLKHHGTDKVFRAIDVAINTIKFFPTVAEINEIISKLPPKWLYKSLEVKQLTVDESKELNTIIDELSKT